MSEFQSRNTRIRSVTHHNSFGKTGFGEIRDLTVGMYLMRFMFSKSYSELWTGADQLPVDDMTGGLYHTIIMGVAKVYPS